MRPWLMRQLLLMCLRVGLLHTLAGYQYYGVGLASQQQRSSAQPLASSIPARSPAPARPAQQSLCIAPAPPPPLAR